MTRILCTSDFKSAACPSCDPDVSCLASTWYLLRVCALAGANAANSANKEIKPIRRNILPPEPLIDILGWHKLKGGVERQSLHHAWATDYSRALTFCCGRRLY